MSCPAAIPVGCLESRQAFSKAAGFLPCCLEGSHHMVQQAVAHLVSRLKGPLQLLNLPLQADLQNVVLLTAAVADLLACTFELLASLVLSICELSLQQGIERSKPGSLCTFKPRYSRKARCLGRPEGGAAAHCSGNPNHCGQVRHTATLPDLGGWLPSM